MSPEAVRELLDALVGPAAWAGADGQLAVANEAFSSWAPSYARARLDHRPDGAWVVAPGRTALAVRAEPLDDGHLVFPAGDGARVALEAVITSVVRRLDRLTDSLDATLTGALRERPAESAAAAVREALSTVEELRALRRQVLDLAPGFSRPAPEPLNLGPLVEEALAAMTGPLPLEFGEISPTCVVNAVREKLFFGVAALVGTLARRLGPDAAIRVDVRSRPGFGQVRFTATAGDGLEGLTLASAREAIEAAGGRLLAVDDGAVVEFSQYDPQAAPGAGTHRGTVLLVDDDPTALAMMGAILRRDGFAVLEADNGVAASTLLRSHGRGLEALVTDAVLPGRSGVDLAAEARRSLPGLPVLIVTGHDEDLVGSSSAPILRKPFAVQAFRDQLQALLIARR